MGNQPSGKKGDPENGEDVSVILAISTDRKISCHEAPSLRGHIGYWVRSDLRALCIIPVVEMYSDGMTLGAL